MNNNIINLNDVIYVETADGRVETTQLYDVNTNAGALNKDIFINYAVENVLRNALKKNLMAIDSNNAKIKDTLIKKGENKEIIQNSIGLENFQNKMVLEKDEKTQDYVLKPENKKFTKDEPIYSILLELEKESVMANMEYYLAIEELKNETTKKNVKSSFNDMYDSYKEILSVKEGFDSKKDAVIAENVILNIEKFKKVKIDENNSKYVGNIANQKIEIDSKNILHSAMGIAFLDYNNIQIELNETKDVQPLNMSDLREKTVKNKGGRQIKAQSKLADKLFTKVDVADPNKSYWEKRAEEKTDLRETLNLIEKYEKTDQDKLKLSLSAYKYINKPSNLKEKIKNALIVDKYKKVLMLDEKINGKPNAKLVKDEIGYSGRMANLAKSAKRTFDFLNISAKKKIRKNEEVYLLNKLEEYKKLENEITTDPKYEEIASQDQVETETPIIEENVKAEETPVIEEVVKTEENKKVETPVEEPETKIIEDAAKTEEASVVEEVKEKVNTPEIPGVEQISSNKTGQQNFEALTDNICANIEKEDLSPDQLHQRLSEVGLTIEHYKESSNRNFNKRIKQMNNDKYTKAISEDIHKNVRKHNEKLKQDLEIMKSTLEDVKSTKNMSPMTSETLNQIYVPTPQPTNNNELPADFTEQLNELLNPVEETSKTK